jgi:hypothetical protein
MTADFRMPNLPKRLRAYVWLARGAWIRSRIQNSKPNEQILGGGGLTILACGSDTRTGRSHLPPARCLRQTAQALPAQPLRGANSAGTPPDSDVTSRPAALSAGAGARVSQSVSGRHPFVMAHGRLGFCATSEKRSRACCRIGPPRGMPMAMGRTPLRPWTSSADIG